MKVFVTGVGGQLGHDVMNELAKRGYEGVGADIAPEYSGAQDGTAVTTMPYVQMDITYAEMVEMVITEVKPDVIHLHSSKAGVLGRWAFNGHKIPLFYTPHGYSFLMKNYSGMKKTVFKLIEEICSKRSCTTISCSEGEHQETLKMTKQATYVDNGIHMEQMDEILAEIGQKDHPFTVYTLGRICYQKNPKMVNEVALALPDIKFLWIGDGDLRHELTVPNIEITGWADRKTALMKSLNADVFVLTSLWEGLPISLLESMYMRKLCVVSNVIGNRNVIHNGQNGYVCDSMEQFVTAIEQNREHINMRLVENAYEDVLKQYNTDVMAKSYSDIYMKSLNSAETMGGSTKKIVCFPAERICACVNYANYRKVVAA